MFQTTDRTRLVLIASAALCAALQAAGCIMKPLTAYSGPTLPKEQVARIHCKDVYVHTVDTTPLRDWFPAMVKYGSETGPSEVAAIDVLPGKHRLIVNFRRQQGGMIAWGVNSFSILYDFKAGQDYAFSLVEMNNGTRTIWRPELIDKTTKSVLATHESKPLPASKSKPGMATVRGIAATIFNTSTGREVVLIPRNKATEDWIAATNKFRSEEGGIFKFAPSMPKERNKPFRATIGYGMGFFEFTDVPPGEYFVIFDSAWGVFCSAPVKVTAGQALVDNVMPTPLRSPSSPAVPEKKNPPANRADAKEKPA